MLDGAEADPAPPLEDIAWVIGVDDGTRTSCTEMRKSPSGMVIPCSRRLRNHCFPSCIKPCDDPASTTDQRSRPRTRTQCKGSTERCEICKSVAVDRPIESRGAPDPPTAPSRDRSAQRCTPPWRSVTTSTCCVLLPATDSIIESPIDTPVRCCNASNGVSPVGVERPEITPATSAPSNSSTANRTRRLAPHASVDACASIHSDGVPSAFVSQI